MIDLHTHTHESDGSLSPDQLVRAAADSGLEALGICDHDTFAGYDRAVPLARAAGLDLVCGIELSTKWSDGARASGRSVHVLGYFLRQPPPADFRAWLAHLQAARRDRNRRLAARLQSLGMDVRLEEVEALGRTLAGRPHFARLMVEKGYVANVQEAFDRYLAESAQAYVEREEPLLDAGIRRIAEAGGLPALAHPVRLGTATEAARMHDVVGAMRQMGLQGIEVWHSDHAPADRDLYAALADRFGLAVTGGTDFHGENKPGVALGTGIGGNVCVPRTVLEKLRSS